MRKCDSAGPQGNFTGIIQRAVFPFPHQRHIPAGKLNPDLMAAPGMEPDSDEAFLSGSKPGEFQPGFFDTLPHFFDYTLRRV